jgi:hypothetical protein
MRAAYNRRTTDFPRALRAIRNAYRMMSPIWPLATIHGNAALRSLWERSGHDGTWRWLKPVANDPFETWRSASRNGQNGEKTHRALDAAALHTIGRTLGFARLPKAGHAESTARRRAANAIGRHRNPAIPALFGNHPKKRGCLCHGHVRGCAAVRCRLVRGLPIWPTLLTKSTRALRG